MEKLYNLKQLEELSGGMSDFVDSMVETFMEHTPGQVEEMGVYLAEGNYERVGQVAHKIKPTIDLLGIESLKELVRSLERDGKEGNPNKNINKMYEDFNEIAQQVFKQLSEDFS